MALAPTRGGGFKSLIDQIPPTQPGSAKNDGDTDMTAPQAPESRTKRPRDTDLDETDLDVGEATPLGNAVDTDMTVPDPSNKRTKDDSYEKEKGILPMDWQSLCGDWEEKCRNSWHHCQALEEKRKNDHETMQNMARENQALKDQVTKLSRPESDVIYDLRQEFKKAQDKKDQTIRVAERRYDTCHAEKETLKANATHLADSDSEWKKTAANNYREKVEVEKQLHESRALVAELKTTVIEAEKQNNNLQQELQDTNEKGRSLEQTYNETVDQMNVLQMDHNLARERVTKLENDCKKLKDENESLIDDYDELDGEGLKLQRAYEDILDDKKCLIYKLGRAEDKIQDLEEAEAKNKDYKEQLFSAKKARTNAQNQLESLGSEFEEAKAELATAYETIIELEKRPTENDLIQFKAAAELLQFNCTELEKRPTEAQVAEAEKKHQELQSRCNELEKRSPVDAQTAEGQQIIQDLRNRCDELEKRPTETQVAEGQRINQELQNRCNELEKGSETQVAEARGIIQELQNRNNELEKGAETQVAEARGIIEALQNQYNELEKGSETQVAEARRINQDLQNRCDELEKRSETQGAEARGIIQDLQNRYNELEKRPTDAQTGTTQNTLQALQHRCDEPEPQSTEVKSGDLPSGQAALVKLQERCNELELRPTDAELLGTQSALTILQDRCNELELRPTDGELLGTQTALTTLQTRFNELEKRSVDADAKLLSLHAEVKSYRDRNKKQKSLPNQSTAELHVMRQTLQKTQADLVAARSALEKCEAREQEAIKLQSVTDVELLDAQWELTDQQTKIKELESELEGKSTPKANEEMEGKIVKLEKQLQEQSAQGSTLAAVRSDLGNLQTRFEKLEKDHAETDQVNRQLKKSSKTLQDSLVERDSEVQELHSKNKKQSEQLARTETDLRISRQKTYVDESHIKLQDDAMSRQNKEISKLKKRCDDLDRVANDSKKTSSESEAALSLIKKDYTTTKKSNGELKEKLWTQKQLAIRKQVEHENLQKEHNGLKEDHDKLMKEKEDGDSLAKKVGDEYKSLEIDHRRVRNSLKTLQAKHAKCPTEASNGPEKSQHTPTHESSKPSTEDTKELVPRSIDGAKQLDDGESIGDNASQAMDETPLDDQLRSVLPDGAPGTFGGGSVSEDAVSRNEDWPDHIPGENGVTASPGPMGGDRSSDPASGGIGAPGSKGGDGSSDPASGGIGAPGSKGGDGSSDPVSGDIGAPGSKGGDGFSDPASGGTGAPGSKGGDNCESPASGGGSRPSETPPTSGTGSLTSQKFQAPSYFPASSSIIAFLLILAIACISFYFVSDHYSRLAYDAVLIRADDTTRAMLLSERMGGGTGTMWPAWLGRIMDDNVVEMIPGLYG